MVVNAGVRARLHVDQELDTGQFINLSGNQSHYLKNVLRLAPDAEVALFNGKDGEWLARIDRVSQGSISLEVRRLLRAQAVEPELWLMFAPIKRARLDIIVQKAVELGVSRLIPIFTERTEVKRLNLVRHRANIVEAAEQCERLTLPEIVEPRAIFDVLANFPGDGCILVCVERGDADPIHQVLQEDLASVGRFAILCGPEGGFSDTELDAFGKLSFIRFVSLGPRILRAETAVISAVTCWQVTLGDWRRRPPMRDFNLAAS